jgi:hypothetical protein
MLKSRGRTFFSGHCQILPDKSGSWNILWSWYFTLSEIRGYSLLFLSVDSWTLLNVKEKLLTLYVSKNRLSCLHRWRYTHTYNERATYLQWYVGIKLHWQAWQKQHGLRQSRFLHCTKRTSLRTIWTLIPQQFREQYTAQKMRHWFSVYNRGVHIIPTTPAPPYPPPHPRHSPRPKSAPYPAAQMT